MPSPALAKLKEEVRLFERLSGANSRALIDELERLRGELADAGLRIRNLEAQLLEHAAKYGTALRQAKTLGAAEWHEQEASKYSLSMGMCERAYHLKIAAELRKELV